MWKPIEDPKRGEFPPSVRFRKMKLYADEDIEGDAVEYLRSQGVNIKSARDRDGHRGKPDSFHAAFAKREKRFLTRNGKDYLDDKEFPFHRLHGLTRRDAGHGQHD